MAFTLNSYKVKGFSSSTLVFVSFLEYMFYIDLKLLSVDIFSLFNCLFKKIRLYLHDRTFRIVRILHMHCVITKFKRIHIVHIGQCPWHINGCGRDRNSL